MATGTEGSPAFLFRPAAPAVGPRLRLVLIGRMEAWGPGSVSVLPRSRKARGLLAVLALSAGSPVPRRRLAALLWSRRGADQQRGSLRQALHELQECLTPVGAPLLVPTRETVMLRAEDIWVDAMQGTEAARPRPEALHLLEDGLLTDLDGLDPAFDAWLGSQRERMRAAVAAASQRPELRRDDAEPPPRPVRERANRGARLGVPPLRVLGQSREEDLSVGLAEEITAALARFRWIFLVDSASLAAAVAREGDEAAARSLGLDFLLSGTVQRGAGKVRVSLRLTDLRSPATLVWSERFEGDSTDLLELQDRIAAEVVARIDPEIVLIEASRAGRRGAIVAPAYDLMLRAIPALHRLDREGFLAAGALLRQALALEPDYAAAHAWLAYWHLFLVGQGWAHDAPEIQAEAEALAARAVSLDPLDAQALTILGHVRAFLQHRVEEAAALHERALTLNPNLAMAWVFSGMAESYLGRHQAALSRLDRYRQLAPCHPHAFFFDAAHGIPLLFLGRFAETVEVGRAATALQPGFSYPYKTYLAALGHLGLREEAAEIRTRLLAIEPDFTIEKALRRTPARPDADRALYAEGLRLAGLT